MDVYLGDVTSDSTSEFRKHAYAKHGVWFYPDEEFPNNVDIAIFQLSATFENSANISPLKLPAATDIDRTNAEFSLIGWKYSDVDGTRTPDKVQSRDFVNDLTPADCFVNDDYFCSTLSDFLFEADLGSPYVVFDTNGVGTLIGVQSGQTTSAIFGTNVAKFISFITQNV